MPIFVGMRALFHALVLLPLWAWARYPPTVIPRPVHMELAPGVLHLECPLEIRSPPGIEHLADLFRAEVDALRPEQGVLCEAPVRIDLRHVTFDTLTPPEWHHVAVTTQGITITAPSEEGLYRGSRTVLQLLEQGFAAGSLPCLTITDHPRFQWRGMHLDAVRHFWPVEFVKKYIDLLARYKMNRFHWHLTDDQGWRIEIKRRPALTAVGGWRRGSQVGPYAALEYDTVRYGGYYTQEQIREVVAYAAERHINVVPEIEMPGHALAALAAYPHVGCSGGPYEVERGWGVFADVFCAGNDSTFALLEDVLTEVMELFPSPIIHIGGDESPKERWGSCGKCQRRIQVEGLKDDHELQSWFIRRIERFVNGKGRTIIGWDEILEGGLAPNAAVMSWRGTEGGIAAARSGHYAVMSPGSHCYFDHYQGDPANEPLAFGGYTPLQKVYAYEPIPAELKPEEHKYILGAQGNLWTEYILTTDHVEYMAVPRMLALAEVLWTPKEQRDEADFIHRLEKEFVRLDSLGVNASRSLYQVRIVPEQGERSGEVKITLIGAREGMRIKVTRTNDPPEPQESTMILINNSTGEYDGPFTISEPYVISASHFSKDIFTDEPFPVSSKTFRFNKATARPTTLSEQPHDRYNAGGAFTLVDGITAQGRRVGPEWLGWKNGVTITIDLGSEQDIDYVGIGTLHEPASWIHAPAAIGIAVSTDGHSFTAVGQAGSSKGSGRRVFGLDRSTRGRYVRLTVQHTGIIPDGMPGAGEPAWLFLDEVEVR